MIGVVVPFTPSSPERDSNWTRVRELYERYHPDWPISVGASTGEEWCKAEAVGEALHWLDASIEMVVISDADVWCDGLDAAVDAVLRGATWAVPHQKLYRLNQGGTSRWKPGMQPRRNEIEESYRGHPGGGLVVMPIDTYCRIPLDPRFRGWGHEDDAWRDALISLIGEPWRGEAPLWHLWHPPQARTDRARGSEENIALQRRYRSARRAGPAAMRLLIEEFRGGTLCGHESQ